MEHLFVPKGNYVFRQGDNNKIFYGIIRGKISIRIRKFSPSIVAIPEKEHESDNDFSDSSKIPYFAKRKSAIKYVKDIENEKVFSEYDLEEEKTVLGPGMCFGEWAMIYNSPTSASTFALEDTDLFCIDKEHFDSTLSRPIMKADVDKKNFIIRKIPSFKKEGNILHVLRMITSQVCKFNLL